MNMNKKMRLFCIAALLMCLISGCSTAKEQKTMTLQTGTLQTTITETGTVVFDDEYTVTSLVPAKILSANFAESDNISKGQVLYTLDNVDLKNQVAQVRVSLEKANEAYRQNQNAASDLTVSSHASGLVTTVYAHVGDYITVGGKIADVVESDVLKLTIPFSVPDETIVYSGMPADVIMSADGSVVQGTVRKVYASSQSFEGGKKGVNIEISLQNPGALKKGDIAFAKIGEYSSVISGTLENETEQTIVSVQTGEIISLTVHEGDRVQIGTTVMRLKNDAITNAVSTTGLNIKDIQTNLSQLEDKLGDYIITSPIDGVVIRRTAKEADIAAVGVPLATLADKGQLYVDADIDEIYIKDISVGQNAEVTIQGQSDSIYSGRVNRIDDSGKEKNGVTYYKVRIELDNIDGLIAGMNTDIKIITNSKKDAKYLPVGAVNDNKVVVLENKKETPKAVTTGIKTKDYIEILSGIDETEQIIVGGNE
jgi:HlyD family secretion protein